MDIIIKRASWTTLVITLGIVLLLVLTFVGRKSAGPAEDLLNYLSTGISNLEDKYVLSSQSHHRRDKLAWAAGVLTDKTQLAREDRFMVGAYDDGARESLLPYVKLEETLGTTFSLIHLYTAWGSKPEQKFPGSLVRGIQDIGSIPFITWEPWLSDFDASKMEGIPAEKTTRDKNGMKAVTTGLYDSYIRKWATEAASVKKTIFLRLGHEMNDPYRYSWGPQNNKPDEFVAMWKHVRKIFKDAGAENVIWVWSPHPAYGQFDEYYPGDDQVDWVGVGVLNYGTVASWSQWWSFKEIFGNYYAELTKYGKPIVISEFGCLEVGGDRNRWFEEAFELLQKDYRKVRGILFFNNGNDITTTNKALDWQIQNDSLLVKTLVTKLRSISGEVN